jgi:hypothetical protein
VQLNQQRMQRNLILKLLSQSVIRLLPVYGGTAFPRALNNCVIDE